MTRGVRWINGREFLLCGRYDDREKALEAKRVSLLYWDRARIVKLNPFEWFVYVHGQLPTRIKQC